MKLISLAVICLAAVAAAPQEADLKKVFKDLSGFRKTARKLSKESRERIEKAIEGKLPDGDLVIWEGQARVPEANPSEPVRILYVQVSATGPKGEIKVGVAIAPEERVVAALLLDPKSDPALAASAFTEQFSRFIYGPALLSPASGLKAARDAAAGRKDAEQKKVDAMFRMMDLMHPVGSAHLRLEEALGAGKGGAAEAEEIAKAFQETAKLLPDLAFLKASQVDSFRKRLDESVKSYRHVAELAKAGRGVEAQAAANEAEKESCSRCHAGTQRIFREQRSQAGIGNGFFAPGHDVSVPPGADPATAAAVAQAVRRAVLVLSEAR